MSRILKYIRALFLLSSIILTSACATNQGPWDTVGGLIEVSVPIGLLIAGLTL